MKRDSDQEDFKAKIPAKWKEDLRLLAQYISRRDDLPKMLTNGELIIHLAKYYLQANSVTRGPKKQESSSPAMEGP